MQKLDLMFKAACRQWHAKFNSCLKEKKEKDVAELKSYVEKQLVAWRQRHGELCRAKIRANRILIEAHQREESARMRIRMLERLCAFMSKTKHIEQSLREHNGSAGGDDEQHE